MIHYGAAGVFGAPRAEPEALPPDQLRVGDVWTNSQGTPHQVLRIEKGVAHLVNEKTGRTCNRAFDNLGSKPGRRWTRISCGPAPQ
jgi:hypothetical protein